METVDVAGEPGALVDVDLDVVDRAAVVVVGRGLAVVVVGFGREVVVVRTTGAGVPTLGTVAGGGSASGRTSR